MSEVNPVELWKAQRHGFGVWSNILHWAEQETPFNEIDDADRNGSNGSGSSGASTITIATCCW
jgi:hypothetical protein